ncbi:MAG: hypothetical protein U9R79_07995 [Armatimonadota bacterium]|nr:hypothetical protein [Armatimonadota bacterium]
MSQLRNLISEMLGEVRPADRELPEMPEVVALSALLLAHVQDQRLAQRLADARSVEEVFDYLAVDRLIARGLAELDDEALRGMEPGVLLAAACMDGRDDLSE